MLILTFMILSFNIILTFDPDYTFNRYLNGKDLSYVTVLVGMSGFFVTGFLDNFLLSCGSINMFELFENIIGGTDANVAAGYANMYADSFGTFISTFLSILLIKLTEVQETPIWSNFLGIFVGCLLG